MASNLWRSINLKELEIPKNVISKRDSVVVSEGIKNVDGANVFFREGSLEGHSDLSDISLLLLHGQNFSSKTWLELGTINLVAAMGYRVIAVDIPGFGNSPKADIPDRSMFLKHLIENFDLQKAAIVSPSMSGYFTLPFLLKYSDTIAGYIPVAPVGIQVLEQQPETKDNRVIETVYAPLKKFLQKPIPDLSHIATPTMVVFGEKDRSRSSALLSLLPHSQCQEIPNGRHPAYLDDPNLWHKLLYNFLYHLSKK